MRLAYVSLSLAVSLLGCKKAADKPATGSGSSAVTGSGSGSAPAAGSDAGSGSAAAAGKGTCYPTDTSFALSTFEADATSALVCLKTTDEAPKERCSKLTLASGAWEDVAPKAPVKRDPPKPALEIKQSEQAVEICDGKCVKLDVPKLPKKEDGADYDPSYTIEISPDKKHALVVGNELKEALLVDTKTGKVKKQLLPKGDKDQEVGECMETAKFLTDDVIYVMTSICAGPGGAGWFFHADGKQFASLAKVNPYGATPMLVDGDRWAFSDFGGGTVEIVDIKAGTSKAIEAARPDECPACLQADDPMMMTDLLVKSGDKLLSFAAQGIIVMDPKTMAIEKTHPFHACPIAPGTP